MESMIASTKALAPGKMMGVEANGKAILLANVKGEYFAMGNICTHMGCTISDGTLRGNRVQCPCHGSTFDITTGAVVRGPAALPEPSYKLRIDGEQIFVSL